MSCAVIMRPMAVPAFSSRSASVADFPSAADRRATSSQVNSLRVAPGWRQVTLMPSRPNSCAEALGQRHHAGVVDAADYGSRRRAANPVMLMIRPQPAPTHEGGRLPRAAQVAQHLHVQGLFKCIGGEIGQTGLAASHCTGAVQFTRMSTPPSSAAARCIRVRTDRRWYLP